MRSYPEDQLSGKIVCEEVGEIEFRNDRVVDFDVGNDRRAAGGSEGLKVGDNSVFFPIAIAHRVRSAAPADFFLISGVFPLARRAAQLSLFQGAGGSGIEF